MYKKIKKDAGKVRKIYLSEYILFQGFSIISGFMGYTHILPILKTIEDIENKEVYFLGTGGSFDNSISKPYSLNISRIYSSSILKLFSKKDYFSLNTIESNDIKKGNCVSVDIPSRENKNWLIKQKNRNIHAVEMEIFPIQTIILKPMTAIIVITDIVRGDNNINMMNIKYIREEFRNSYNLLLNKLLNS